MARSRQSAKTAGTRFETAVARYLAAALEDDRIERRARTGAKDTGDITGVRFHGGRVVIECKDRARLELGAWLEEAEIERLNDDALIGVVAHKRRGNACLDAQFVTMTLATFARILGGIV